MRKEIPTPSQDPGPRSSGSPPAPPLTSPPTLPFLLDCAPGTLVTLLVLGSDAMGVLTARPPAPPSIWNLLPQISYFHSTLSSFMGVSVQLLPHGRNHPRPPHLGRHPVLPSASLSPHFFFVSLRLFCCLPRNCLFISPSFVSPTGKKTSAFCPSPEPVPSKTNQSINS